MSTLYNNIIGKVLFLFLFNTSFNVFANTTVTPVSDTISFIVYFNENKEQQPINEGDYMQALIDIYELEIVSFFDVANDIRAFVVVAKKDVYMPLTLARELSFIEGVLMVELGNLVRVKEEI
ncbi:hypothetical protein OAK19_03250 [Aureispira]|nr:hypothetical protein [Aureispira sp.]